MIPDYESFEGFETGFQLQHEAGGVEDDEDFLTVDRDVAELFEEGDNDDESEDGEEDC